MLNTNPVDNIGEKELISCLWQPAVDLLTTVIFVSGVQALGRPVTPLDHRQAVAIVTPEHSIRAQPRS